jgi:hypothetical protein
VPTSRPVRHDLRKQSKRLYSPSPSNVEVIEVPAMRFIMTDGEGDPSSKAFQDATQTLYNLSYTLRFDFKLNKAIDFPVMALEDLLWTDGTQGDFDVKARETWKWTLMIVQPDQVATVDVETAVDKVVKKRKNSCGPQIRGIPRVGVRPNNGPRALFR